MIGLSQEALNKSNLISEKTRGSKTTTTKKYKNRCRNKGSVKQSQDFIDERYVIWYE